MIYTIYDKILVKNEYILRKGWIRLWKKIIWMPYFTKIELTETEVSFKWNNEMKPFLTNLKENYTQYLSNDYLKLKSVYSQNLYEQLK